MTFQEPRILYAFVAALCFATTSISFRMGYDSGDQRYAAFAFLMLAAGYLFMMPLLSDSMSYASVVVSALTQLLALAYAFLWLHEPMNGTKLAGVVFSMSAIVAFSIPTDPRS